MNDPGQHQSIPFTIDPTLGGQRRPVLSVSHSLSVSIPAFEENSAPYSAFAPVSPPLGSGHPKTAKRSVHVAGLVSPSASRRKSATPVSARPWQSVGPEGGIFPDSGAADEFDLSGRPKQKAEQTYVCEKCSKVYRHSTCLVKHRWEHTAHWKEASKLLLSKHQQVQLLEAAAILKAAACGSSLPDEKSLWPAAVSPPSSGLLGSHSLNIDTLTANVQTARSDDIEMKFDDSRHSSPADDDTESYSTGDDAMLAGEMFDMEIDPAVERTGPTMPIVGYFDRI